jgi:general stress protein 26
MSRPESAPIPVDHARGYLSLMSQSPEENLHRAAAIEKIRKIALSARVAFLGTVETGEPPRFEPMAVQDVDDQGFVWFISGRSSEKNQRITRDPRIHLLVANPGDSQYLSLTGTATISDDRALREKTGTPSPKRGSPGAWTTPN